ncbi:hypothetical protein H4P12_01445 [Paracoccus sp. 11-3]|uniref:Uncharacterized protein n=1 Tax=Paracoccus amoyensis TaxID=2760093 RepID=A0A926G6E8_9RHOB|nr:hypothetical protein [Paracoccus amoyensis]MBC9245403.1 hypothetical protein [Paracoccus amoyensis]
MKRATRIIAAIFLALAVVAMVAGDLMLAGAAEPALTDTRAISALQRDVTAQNKDFNSFARLG